ncbi:sugar transferase, partial [Klebsiella michiganensis]
GETYPKSDLFNKADKMEKRIQYDLEYIQSWSLLLDIKIVFLTFFRGFVGKNAF